MAIKDSDHPVERFFALLADFGSYPAGVGPIPARIPGTAFFPGGSGLWNTQPSQPLPPLPVGGVMIVGHNFDSEAGYLWSLHHAGENLKGPTWANLLDLLNRVELAPERCFFTNAYVGLKLGSSATGAFPGASDPDFVRRCKALLAEEIRVMCPRVIATLGAYVPAFLAPMAPALQVQWSNARTLTALDNQRAALVPSVLFPNCSEPVTVVALTHPAYRRLNVQSRAYGDLRGDAAEVRMLTDALHGTLAPPSG